MTYADTVAYLEAQALGVGAASFWHGPQTNQDINYAEPFPQVDLYLLPAPLVGPNVVYQVNMSFNALDQHENGGPDTLGLQGAMDVLSQQFIAALREDEQFDVSERVERAPQYRKGARVATGFFISFTLTARAAVC